MPIEYAYPQEAGQTVCTDLPTIKRMSKKRYVELVILAKSTSDYLEKKGLKREEFCRFGRIMEQMIELD